MAEPPNTTAPACEDCPVTTDLWWVMGNRSVTRYCDEHLPKSKRAQAKETVWHAHEPKAQP